LLHKVNYITLTRMGVELILGMEDVINYLNEVQAENKKLKEELLTSNTALQIVKDENEVNKKNMFKFMKQNKELTTEIAHKNKKFGEWCEENKKLKEQIEEQKVIIVNEVVIKEKLQQENKELKEEEEMKLDAVEAMKFLDKMWDEEEKEWVDEEPEQYKESQIDYYVDAGRKVVLKDGRTLETNDYYLSESDEEEELSKYEKEDSDWARSYGFSVKDGEYRAVMAGGGDHWEDYVIKRDGCFIHNGCGYSAVAQFISCPEANYVKVVHIGETYELEEGETDMYEMITECYQEEIMEYCDDEEPIEEPDSP